MTVPEFTFLTVDGGGDPNTSLRYAAGLSVLYVAAYTLKVAVREALGIDYRVLPLEGPWVSRHPVDFTGGDKRDRLRLMVFEEGASAQILHRSRTRPRHPPSHGCGSSSRRASCVPATSTTRSTSATRIAPGRGGCAR